LVVAGVDLSRLEDFAEIVRVDRALGFLTNGSHGGDHDRREDADDRDDR